MSRLLAAFMLLVSAASCNLNTVDCKRMRIYCINCDSDEMAEILKTCAETREKK